MQPQSSESGAITSRGVDGPALTYLSMHAGEAPLLHGRATRANRTLTADTAVRQVGLSHTTR